MKHRLNLDFPCNLWLPFAHASWQRFVLDFAAAADGDLGGFAVGDAPFFAVEIAGGKRWQWSSYCRGVVTRIVDACVIDRGQRADHRFADRSQLLQRHITLIKLSVADDRIDDLHDDG